MKKRSIALVVAVLTLLVACLPVSAAEWNLIRDNYLYENGFEASDAEINGAGTTIVSTVARTGSSSLEWCMEDEYADNTIYLFMNGTLTAEEATGKWLIGEIWYKIDGEVTADTTVEFLHDYNGSGEAQKLWTSASLNEINTVYPKTVDREGTLYGADSWERIRVPFMCHSTTQDWEAYSMDIKLNNAPIGTKLYLDDFKVIKTDNALEMWTMGNSDFETYTAQGINGWAAYGTTEGSTSVSVVETDNGTKGEGRYCLELKGANTTKFGVYVMSGGVNWKNCNLQGKSALFSLDVAATLGTGHTFQNAGFQMFSASGSGYTQKTLGTYYGTATLKSVANVFAIETTQGNNFIKIERPAGAANAATTLYFDNAGISEIAGNEFISLKNGQASATQFTRDKIKNGDTVYPAVWMKTANLTNGTAQIVREVDMYVARYVIDENGNKILDDVQIDRFPMAVVSSKWQATPSSAGTPGIYDATTGKNATGSAITIPATGNYEYKCMAWNAKTLAPLFDTTDFTVGQ